jgi:hypothetical protein
MKLLKSCLAIVAVSCAGGALACDYPPLVAVPEGTSATIDQMVAAQETVRAYMEGMDTYLNCVNSELEAAGDDAPEEFKAILVSRHNAAVAEMEAVAASFNDQIAAYREANPEANAE